MIFVHFSTLSLEVSSSFGRMISLSLYFLLLGSFQVSAQTAAPNTSASCSDAYKFQPGNALSTNVPQVLDVLRKNASKTRYSIYSTQGSINDQAYGLLNCRGDIPLQECSTCVSTAIRLLNNTCLSNSTKGGRVQLDNCFVRYEDHFFASAPDDAPMKSNCSKGNATEEFRSNAKLALAYLQEKVPQIDIKFLAAVAGLSSSSSSSPAFALGQCVRDLSTADCRLCITNAQSVLSQGCPGAAGGACFSATCQLQYASFKFFSGQPVNATALTTGGSSSKSKAVTIGVAVAGGAILLLAAALAAIYVKKRKGPQGHTELQDTLHRGPVTFSYDMLKKCTGNFDESHKLGEGGFGVVYKGFFVDGTEVAIKKLSVATKHGEQQFLNEVKVISSVQHRNLVKLLGCCVRGSERLLVYEFCKNNSLDSVLFGKPQDSPALTWETRFNVLLGTARGLSYLHEDSQVRIVHRDIKPSNILLDENFDAKIADFGLARLCTEDEVSNIVTTKVAGTYGYMAPEYAFHGELSEKADVFSFGIVILEAVCGKRNRHQILAEQAWELHAAGGGEKFDQLFDPDMVIENAPRVREVIGIALMCTQGSAQARPPMSHVIAMLAGHSNVYVPMDADLKPYASSSSFLGVAPIGETPSSTSTAKENSNVEPR